ncbi:MAG: Hsp20/alpha crystallin family protein [Planctomycetes bacterium]|nr:Hsp20/alpha crystallin family protein [Planctomycetota bacterium]
MRSFASAGGLVADISVTDGENQVTIAAEMPGLGEKDVEVSPRGGPWRSRAKTRAF